MKSNVELIYRYVDYVNLMAYDMVQSDSSVTGLLAPLSIIVSSCENLNTPYHGDSLKFRVFKQLKSIAANCSFQWCF